MSRKKKTWNRPGQPLKSPPPPTGGHPSRCGVFPRHAIWIVHGATVTWRLAYTLMGRSMWILHPDEVFQAVEVGHSEAAGFGFRPYEVLTEATAQAQERQLGMYSLRSFLLPRVYGLVISLNDWLGLGVNPFVACKLFHAAVAAHLPLAAYYVTCRLLQHTRDDSDVTTVSPRSNSTAGKRKEMLTNGHTVGNGHIENGKNGYHFQNEHMKNGFATNKQNGHVMVEHNGHVANRPNGVYEQNGHVTCKGKYCVINNHSSSGVRTHRHVIQKQNEQANNSAQSLSKTSKKSEIVMTVSDTAILSAILVSSSAHLTIFGTHTLANSFLSPFVFLTLGYVVSVRNEPSKDQATFSNTTFENNNTITDDKQCDPNDAEDIQEDQNVNKSTWTPIFVRCLLELYHNQKSCSVIVGVLIGLLCYTRVDLILCYTISFVFLISSLSIHHIYGVVGVIAGCLVGGLEDWVSYGTPFISPYQWVKFNVFGNIADKLFGWNDTSIYFNGMFYLNASSLVASASTAFTVLWIIYERYVKEIKSKARSNNVLIRISAVIFLMMFSYCLKGHKEIRFVHNVLVMLLIAASLTVTIWLKSTSGIKLRIAICFWVLFYVANNTRCVLDSTIQKEWSYGRSADSGPVNQCLLYLSEQKDVTGVVLEYSIHNTGAYSLLHHEVPLFSLVHYEYQEFDHKARVPVLSNCLLLCGREPRTIRASIISRVSDFISVLNKPLLLKAVIEKPQYNYVVTREEWGAPGYEPVYAAGEFKVLKRSNSTAVNARLYRLAESTPIGTNVTILEYEGSWLHSLGLHTRAIERLEAALALGATRPRVYQILSLSYSGAGMDSLGRHALKRCVEQHNLDTCMEPQPKVILHADLNIL